LLANGALAVLHRQKSLIFSPFQAVFLAQKHRPNFLCIRPIPRIALRPISFWILVTGCQLSLTDKVSILGTPQLAIGTHSS
jgi:hypothetical protein